MIANAILGEKLRCEGITAAGLQCRCYATQKVNEVPYCDQHARKAIAIAEAYAQGREKGR